MPPCDTEILKRQDHGSITEYATSLKEKTMTPKFRFIQANFSATLLWSAALAVALFVQASPARAEVVTLVCQSEANTPQLPGWGSSFTLRINYDQKIVDLLHPSGSVWFSEAATITESYVQWFRWDSSGKAPSFKGSLNRLSGQGEATISEKESNIIRQMSGPCRRATQKF